MDGEGFGLMRLGDAIADLPLRSPLGAAADTEVTGVQHDSRRVVGGDVFVAWRGELHDGRVFAPDAVARGAAAVLAFGPPPAASTVPWLEVDDPRARMGHVAARLYGHPERELLTVGVTGTNGKSTTCQLIGACLTRSGRSAAVVGTLGRTVHRPGSAPAAFESLSRAAEDRTTPESSDLFRMLRRAVDLGARSAAIEVSSHALDQGRMNGMEFDAAVFTNLTRDHLDYHPSLEAYFAAKRRLFALLRSGGRAILNVDDEHGRRLAAELGDGDRVARFSASGSRAAEVRVVGAELDLAGVRAEVETPAGTIALNSRLLGRFNLENLTAAVAASWALGVSAEAVRDAVAAQPPLAGRLEPVDRAQDFPVLVDYAHTDGGLRAALSAVRELSDRRIAVVFGCGGDRDRGKRELMGRAAGELADLAIVTDDNPRSEEPGLIRAAIVAGLDAVRGCACEVIADRRAAIRRAVSVAGTEPGWTVLIAGKGHEATQTIGDRKVPFRDRDEAEAALNALNREFEGETAPC